MDDHSNEIDNKADIEYQKKRIKTVTQDTNNQRQLNTNLLEKCDGSIKLLIKNLHNNPSKLSSKAKKEVLSKEKIDQMNSEQQTIICHEKLQELLNRKDKLLYGNYNLSKEVMGLLNKNLENLKSVENLRESVADSKEQQNQSYIKFNNEEAKYKNKLGNYEFEESFRQSQSFESGSLNSTLVLEESFSNRAPATKKGLSKRSSSKFLLKPIEL